MSWLRNICGRLKSDFRYSSGIVYNNFPWPMPTDKQRAAIETAAQEVLDARLQFPESSLADLYDPLTTPPLLTQAHLRLDRAMDTAYGKTAFTGETARVALLFERYQALTAPLFAKPKRPRRPSLKTQTTSIDKDSVEHLKIYP